MKRSVWIGYDSREELAYQVCRRSLLRRLGTGIEVHKLDVRRLMERGIYLRPTHVREDGRWIDELSIRPGYDGALSTWHANGRFLVPALVQEGWALFMDGDMLVRDNISRVFERLDPAMAVYCVKHAHEPSETTKKDGDVQTRYARKNWSSFVIFNCDHVSNKNMHLLANTAPGRDLHAFCWLHDDQIGELDGKWNHLVGYSSMVEEPAVVHFTSGLPNVPGYENCEYAEEWRREAALVNLVKELAAS